MRILIMLFVIFFVLINVSNAQLTGQAKIDSLLKELPKMKKDTNGVNLLNDLCFEYYSLNPDEGIKYGEQGLKLAEKLSWREGEAYCYNSLGVVYSFGKSDYPKALEYYGKSLKIFEELGNKSGVAINLGNIAFIYANQSDYPKALEYYQRVLNIYEEMGNKSGISNCLGNIGIIYRYQSDYPKALEYYSKSLKINEELGNKSGIANNLGNIGTIYGSQSDYPKALEYFGKALKINEELGNKSGVALNLGNIGNIYISQSDYPKALEYYGKALKINEELGNKSGVALNLGAMGNLYLKLSQDSVNINPSELNVFFSLNKDINLNNSIEYLLQAIELYEEIGELHQRSIFFKTLADAYKQKGDYKKAFEAFKEYKTLQDSVFNLDKAKDIANLEAKRENELKDKEIEVLQAEKKAQKFQSYLLGGGVIVLLGAFGVAFLRFREKKKLSDKLAIQNAEIETQKSIVEEKNEQITSSIKYASTIQDAILPWKSTLNKDFREIFVFYKPKAIVSGDSYWFQEVDGIKFLAVIDCTGHGIPGAMLTVIASSVLDDAVLSKKLTSTHEILTFMNEKVTAVLNQRLKENSIRDGMEVALIAIHQDIIQFSGAGRPLFYKNGTFEIVKTDRREIAGKADDDIYNFTSIEIPRTDNITLYLTTDGFADQMNEDGKKYSSKQFINLLENISYKPFHEQNEILETEFNSHKGNREQIDDVTILGVKI